MGAGPVSIRKRVMGLLITSANPLTATQIKQFMDASYVGPPVKLSSLSGILKRMYDAGELRRVDDWGPRGGYGYEVNHS